MKNGKRSRRVLHPGAPAALLALASAFAQAADASDAALLEARFHGDRMGACLVAADIDHDTVTRSRYCARSGGDPAPGFDDAFEIGSITKTMTAFLVADLVDRHLWTLDDPIAAHLPPGAVVPRQGERQILVRDLLTHRSGLPTLPSRMHPADGANPYATLTEADVLQSLAQARLTCPIGSAYEYSNFAMMVLSLAVAHAEGGDLESVLRGRLFGPLDMRGAGIAPMPAHRAIGHLSTGTATSPWTIATDLAGFGMVHASLDDMVRYARAELGDSPPDIARKMRMTQAPLAEGIGMNWMLAPMGGRQFVLHEGGTGGFTSIVVLEPARRRAVVILADTLLVDVGGLQRLALAMMDGAMTPGRPRVATPVPSELRAAIQGRFDFGPLELTIRDDDGRLTAQATGQPAIELLHDSEGDLYPLGMSALLTPELENGRVDRFFWRQGGGLVEAHRKPAPAHAPQAVAPADPRWKDWLGDYTFASAFGLRLFQEDGHLMVRATGQGAIKAVPSGADRAEIAAVGAVLQFERDNAGTVIGVRLQQNGHVLEGMKQ